MPLSLTTSIGNTHRFSIALIRPRVRRIQAYPRIKIFYRVLTCILKLRCVDVSLSTYSIPAVPGCKVHAQAVCEWQTTFCLSELVLAWTTPSFQTFLTDEASINNWDNADGIERVTAALKRTISDGGCILTGLRRMADRNTVGSHGRCC